MKNILDFMKDRAEAMADNFIAATTADFETADSTEPMQDTQEQNKSE